MVYRKVVRGRVRVQRRFLGPELLDLVHSLAAEGDFALSFYHRRWRGRESIAVPVDGGSGRRAWESRPVGCSMFVPDDVTRRIVEWASRT